MVWMVFEGIQGILNRGRESGDKFSFPQQSAAARHQRLKVREAGADGERLQI